ncbi:MAG: hypothetical protein WCP92_03510 [bacterium]
MKLENLNLGTILQPSETKANNVSLGDSGLMSGNKSKYHNQYRKLFLISFFVILVTGITSVVLRLYTSYIYYASQAIPSTTYQTYIDTYKQ